MFVLGNASRGKLVGVKPQLADTIRLAIGISTVDFRVQQTRRSHAEQLMAVNSGNSRTMHSRHFVQPDGFVWAADLVVLKNGEVDWTFNHYAAIAFAMDKAATQLKVAHHIRWGCAWDRVLSDFGGDEQAYLDEARAYAKRHKGSDLLDAPHFEYVP